MTLITIFVFFGRSYIAPTQSFIARASPIQDLQGGPFRPQAI